MIKKLEIEGVLTQESQGKMPWLAINGENLASFLPAPAMKPVAEIFEVVISKEGKYVPTEGFWARGDRISTEDLEKANEAHRLDPETEPLYLTNLIEEDWGKAVITIEFVTE